MNQLSSKIFYYSYHSKWDKERNQSVGEEEISEIMEIKKLKTGTGGLVVAVATNRCKITIQITSCICRLNGAQMNVCAVHTHIQKEHVSVANEHKRKPDCNQRRRHRHHCMKITISTYQCDVSNEGISHTYANTQIYTNIHELITIILFSMNSIINIEYSINYYWYWMDNCRHLHESMHDHRRVSKHCQMSYLTYHVKNKSLTSMGKYFVFS